MSWLLEKPWGIDFFTAPMVRSDVACGARPLHWTHLRCPTPTAGDPSGVGGASIPSLSLTLNVEP